MSCEREKGCIKDEKIGEQMRSSSNIHALVLKELTSHGLYKGMILSLALHFIRDIYLFNFASNELYYLQLVHRS